MKPPDMRMAQSILREAPASSQLAEYKPRVLNIPFTGRLVTCCNVAFQTKFISPSICEKCSKLT
eukprot:3720233-Amphidinium_carterae.1